MSDDLLFYDGDKLISSALRDNNTNDEFDNDQDEKDELNVYDKLTARYPTTDLSTLSTFDYQINTSIASSSLSDVLVYLPNLTELNLNESNICSIRELGSYIKNIEILNISNCNLLLLDGISIFKKLKNINLSKNHIYDLEPLCNCYSKIEILNIENNLLYDYKMIEFLPLTLTNLTLLGNPISYSNTYRQFIFKTLPQLNILDNKSLLTDHVYADTAEFDINILPLPLQCDLMIAQKVDQQDSIFIEKTNRLKQSSRPLTSALSRNSNNLPYSRLTSTSRPLSRLNSPDYSTLRSNLQTATSFVSIDSQVSFESDAGSELTKGGLVYGNPITSLRRNKSANSSSVASKKSSRISTLISSNPKSLAPPNISLPISTLLPSPPNVPIIPLSPMKPDGKAENAKSFRTRKIKTVDN